MKTVQIRGVVLGEGRPRICVPLIGAAPEALLKEAGQAKAAGAELVEWRAGCSAGGMIPSTAAGTLAALRGVLGELPLLFTFRTAREGGEKSLPPDEYAALLCAAAASGNADAVDVELFAGEETVRRVVAEAHRNRIAAVVSSHDFVGTPNRDEILARLARMRELGGDLPKIAVTPQSFADVLTLMGAVYDDTRSADGPVIAMSMTKLGCVSRIAGQYYGSALTFGSVGRASAPGQLAVEDLRRALDMIE